MLCRIDYDSYMSAPDDEIAWLRLGYSLKTLDSIVEIRRSRIRIGEPCTFVDRVHEMGTVLPGRSAKAQIQCGRDYRQTVVFAENCTLDGLFLLFLIARTQR
jgi:hypothetical protein